MPINLLVIIDPIARGKNETHDRLLQIVNILHKHSALISTCTISFISHQKLQEFFYPLFLNTVKASQRYKYSTKIHQHLHLVLICHWKRVKKMLSLFPLLPINLVSFVRLLVPVKIILLQPVLLYINIKGQVLEFIDAI